MSYEIEYRRWCLKIGPVGQFDSDFYFGFVETGPSNTTDYSGQRTRNTITLLAESGDDFMQKIVRISCECESGMLKPGGRDTKPENYIANWRHMQSQAIDLKIYLEKSSMLIVGIDEMRPVMERKIESLMKKGGYKKVMAKDITHFLHVLDGNKNIEDLEYPLGKDLYHKTLFKFTKENCRELIELFSWANIIMGNKWRPYSTSFSANVFEYCQYEQNASC